MRDPACRYEEVSPARHVVHNQDGMRTILAAWIAVLCAATVFGQNAVPVGRGSYADFPPVHEGEGPQEMTQDRVLYVVSTDERPIPTNDWWTDLVISRYAGDLWAYPLCVSADEQGLNLSWPHRWNEDGSRMVPEHSIEVHGDAVIEPDRSDMLIADFEAPTYGADWKAAGDAFGGGPARGEFPGQMRVAGFLGRGLVNSFNGGDAPTGTLTSSEFRIQKKYIHFLIAGGPHEGETCVNLLVRGQRVRTATGQSSEDLQWHRWEVSDLLGKPARIEIVDYATGGWGHICVDHIFQSDNGDDPAIRFDTAFAPADARAVSWGDWTVRFRMAQESRGVMDVTLGHGLPYVWMEFSRVLPRLKIGAGVTFFDRSGEAVALPTTNHCLGIEAAGRCWGVFAPADTAFDAVGDEVRIRFAGRKSYLVISPLPARRDLAYFNRYARAVPRDSRLTWEYDPKAARVTTQWSVDTEVLDGAESRVVQGWIPHHYRGSQHGLSFNDVEYMTPRGLMKCAVGNRFEIGFRFSGLLPNLPPPQTTGMTNDYDASRMLNYVADYAQKTNYGSDTYWGGKDLLYFAQYMVMARELEHPAFEVLRARLREALVDWFTYTPGELERYFARYPNWKALVGFNESYWSYQFTDHHFHYGYFTTAAGLLGMYDKEFLNGYGEMARLVAREYANWDRGNKEFPFLRTFDPWLGHSWAGGFSSPGGNNQESSSEAMQSWGGLFLLGTAMGDEELVAAGAMGYAMESQATLEYWFDRFGDTFPAEYPHPAAGILLAPGQAYATYFSDDPAWIYGIQWLPLSPFLLYLAEDPDFARRRYEQMMTDRLARKGRNDTSDFGNALGNVVLGYRLLFDPDAVAGEMDDLWRREDPVARENYTGGLTYYFAHSLRSLGVPVTDCHADIPTSRIFRRRDGTMVYVVFNPSEAEVFTTVYRDGQAIGRLRVPPHTLVKRSELLPLP